MAKIKYSFLSEFPQLFGIVYAYRSDTLSDKKIYLALQEKKTVKALKIALGSSARKHRYIALTLYYLHQKFDWIPPLWITLTLCQFVGPSASWFKYLLHSAKRPSLQSAVTILEREKKKRQRILDVGCGLGHLEQQFSYRSNCEWICVDKNFFTLFLAKMYHNRRDITYICADTELQQIFPQKYFSAVVLVECFAFICQKDVFVEKVSGWLEKSGKFIMMNVHEDQESTEMWGYGIDHRILKKLLMRYFRKVTWHDHRHPIDSERNSFKELDPTMYSFVAEK